MTDEPKPATKLEYLLDWADHNPTTPQEADLHDLAEALAATMSVAIALVDDAAERIAELEKRMAEAREEVTEWRDGSRSMDLDKVERLLADD